jgi:hypothetical protein
MWVEGGRRGFYVAERAYGWKTIEDGSSHQVGDEEKEIEIDSSGASSIRLNLTNTLVKSVGTSEKAMLSFVSPLGGEVFESGMVNEGEIEFQNFTFLLELSLRTGITRLIVLFSSNIETAQKEEARRHSVSLQERLPHPPSPSALVESHHPLFLCVSVMGKQRADN